MKLDRLLSLLTMALLLLALACGKDRENAPSNREGYTDSSIPAPGAPPKKDEKAAPDEEENVEDGNGYVVEVGSFETMEAAMKLSQELRLARINNDIQKIGGKKFRVVVGKGYSRTRAEKMLDKVIEAGFGNAKVVSAQTS